MRVRCQLLCGMLAAAGCSDSAPEIGADGAGPQIEAGATAGDAAPHTEAGDVAPQIEVGGVAQIRIGDSVTAIESAYPADRLRDVDLRLEGMPAPAVEIMPAGAARPDALVAELIEQDGTMIVYRIQVRDPLFETDRGVGVGDSVGDLRAAYPAHRLIGGEGNVGFRIDELAATFLLDTDAGGQWPRSSDASRVPDDVEIERILLTGIPPDDGR